MQELKTSKKNENPEFFVISVRWSYDNLKYAEHFNFGCKLFL